ncbi:uncharacterized protein LOC34620988 [Cyclospora cayetanensis]|uniref:Uncharacterized protein LOC34620988 n=1 Tax=Cyclospora cayetanensis TaxID=88456 RepID=A0A6P6RY44_9EIME|nr:uncharacterized protein LOC34620988 [Cyclospora cayetanensis]
MTDGFSLPLWRSDATASHSCEAAADDCIAALPACLGASPPSEALEHVDSQTTDTTADLQNPDPELKLTLRQAAPLSPPLSSPPSAHPSVEPLLLTKTSQQRNAIYGDSFYEYLQEMQSRWTILNRSNVDTSVVRTVLTDLTAFALCAELNLELEDLWVLIPEGTKQVGYTWRFWVSEPLGSEAHLRNNVASLAAEGKNQLVLEWDACTDMGGLEIWVDRQLYWCWLAHFSSADACAPVLRVIECSDVLARELFFEGGSRERPLKRPGLHVSKNAVIQKAQHFTAAHCTVKWKGCGSWRCRREPKNICQSTLGALLLSVAHSSCAAVQTGKNRYWEARVARVIFRQCARVDSCGGCLRPAVSRGPLEMSVREALSHPADSGCAAAFRRPNLCVCPLHPSSACVCLNVWTFGTGVLRFGLLGLLLLQALLRRCKNFGLTEIRLSAASGDLTLLKAAIASGFRPVQVYIGENAEVYQTLSANPQLPEPTILEVRRRAAALERMNTFLSATYFQAMAVLSVHKNLSIEPKPARMISAPAPAKSPVEPQHLEFVHRTAGLNLQFGHGSLVFAALGTAFLLALVFWVFKKKMKGGGGPFLASKAKFSHRARYKDERYLEAPPHWEEAYKREPVYEEDQDNSPEALRAVASFE